MANEKKVDATSEKISTMYKQGIAEIVSALYKANSKATPIEMAKGLSELPIQKIVENKLQNIKKEFVKGHVEVLEEVKPPVK